MASSSPTPLSTRVPRPGTETMGLVPTETVGLHAKLAKVMEAVGYIPKGGHNVAQNYDFVRASDVADKVREQLANLGVTFVPTDVGVIGDVELETRNGGRQQLLTLRVSWLVTDSESGESITVQSIGAGADTGDKASYKAMTGALKYALLTTFLIPTGDDPENESPERATRRTTQGRTSGDAAPAPSREPSSLPPERTPSRAPVATAPEPPELSDEEMDSLVANVPHASVERMKPAALFKRAEDNNVDRILIYQTADRMFGKPGRKVKVTDLDEEQVGALAAEVGLA